MGTRSLEIMVTSAKGLDKVSKLDVFVAVKLSGDPKLSDNGDQRTHVAKDGGTSPRWINEAMKFTIDQTLAEANRLVITFKIKYEQRDGGGDKDIGEVHVPVKELIDHLGNDKDGQRYVTYKIKKTNGKLGGEISFSYSLTGPVVVSSPRYIAHQPVRPTAPFCPTALVRPTAPVCPTTPYKPVSNGPVLSMLLPSVGSFSHGYIPCHQHPVYPPLVQPEIQPPNCFPGLYPPHVYPTSYIPENQQTVYPTTIFPGLSYPPEGYPTMAQPQIPPGLYPPMSPYRY